MRKKNSLAIAFGLVATLTMGFLSANSQQKSKNVPWTHYEPQVCINYQGDMETSYPVCETPMFDGPCDRPKYCTGGGILW
ncbi:MAG: hypothetical protein EOO42_21810 [Flavobacteriales bacterium]|nr:MAG: hypothetical protein EOO42_21810 [Flavobacteriales bacterium]